MSKTHSTWLSLSRVHLHLGWILLCCFGQLACGDVPAPVSTSPGGVPALSTPPEFYLGGIQVNEENLDTWFDALEARGMNTVSVTDYARQGLWDSDDLWWHETNPAVVDEVRAAQDRGMQAVLILRVDLNMAEARNRSFWHGMIHPASDEALASWFRKYTEYAVGWAEVAEREGVDMLMIGSELNALAETVPTDRIPSLQKYYLNPQSQEEVKRLWLDQQAARSESDPDKANIDTYLAEADERIQEQVRWAMATMPDGGDLAALNRRRQTLLGHWRRLIQRLREVYRGRLGYAANFDQYQTVAFWPELDVMGINAYFPLRTHLQEERDTAALEPMLQRGWQQAMDDIAAFRRQQGLDLPVIFTEMGYTFRANSTVQPWAHEGSEILPVSRPDGDSSRRLVVWDQQPVDPEERTLAVRALHRAHGLQEPAFLQGILYWKLSTHAEHRDIESFVLLIHEASQDPLIKELQRFSKPSE